MPTKQDKLHLYHSQDETSPNAKLVSTDGETLLQSTETLKLKGAKISLTHSTDASLDIDDLCTFLSNTSTSNALSSTNTLAVQSNDRCTGLEGDLTSLTSTVSSNNSTLQSSIVSTVQTETTARLAQISGLTQTLSAETQNRVSSVNSLTAEIAVERGRVNALLEGSDISLDTLQEIVTAYQNADTSLINQIGTINTTLTNLVADFNSLTGQD